tara:strand:- start:272 stop:505 length:234 start_codon:yes stop_codon:yes gene_type:complete
MRAINGNGAGIARYQTAPPLQRPPHQDLTYSQVGANIRTTLNRINPPSYSHWLYERQYAAHQIFQRIQTLASRFNQT